MWDDNVVSYVVKSNLVLMDVPLYSFKYKAVGCSVGLHYEFDMYFEELDINETNSKWRFKLDPFARFVREVLDSCANHNVET